MKLMSASLAISVIAAVISSPAMLALAYLLSIIAYANKEN